MSNPQSPIPNPQFPITKIPCVIFAGGKSSRMGRDKALLPFGGYETLAEYQYDRLRKLFGSVHLSAKEKKFPFDAPLVRDVVGEEVFAPTAGLLAALQALRSDFFALSVDAPFVDERVVGKLYEVYETGDWDAVVARSPSGSHPMCAIYTLRIQPPLEAMVRDGSHRLQALLREVRTGYVDFDDEAPFFNVNRPEEYEAAKKKAEGLS